MSTDESTFNVLLIGAGEINFGSIEGSWNHSLRLERALGNRLRVLGILDVDATKARAQVDQKCKSGVHGYQDTKIWSTLEDVAKSLESCIIHLAILGVPPHFRGSTSPDADMDLRLIQSLPHVERWLVEKPISAKRYSIEAGQVDVARAWDSCPAVVGVGYHLASLKAVAAAKKLIQERGLRIMATEARYNMAYEFARKPSWWDKEISCGPIVEQATHLANLSLLFAGEPILSSVLAHTVEHSEDPGQLSKIGVDESLIPPSNRVPRYTNAIWKYTSGAVGSLSHSIALHGTTYDTEFGIICDGYIIKLVGLYSDAPTLIVQGAGQAQPETTRFENDDPYQTQLEALIAGDPACSYRQALETYALTWAIRLAGEAQRDMTATTNEQKGLV